MPKMTARLLAYRCSFISEDFVSLVHGETRGKAKARFWRVNPIGPMDRDQWLDIRLTRIPGLDDKPITYENAIDAGFNYVDLNETGDDGNPRLCSVDEFINDCDCPMCKASHKSGFTEKDGVLTWYGRL